MNLRPKSVTRLISLSPGWLGSLCLAILLLILVAGLRPFNFFPINEVEWLPDKNGVHFYGQGIVIGSEAWLKDQKSLSPEKPISLELWLRPLMETTNLPSILTLYDGKTPDIFLIGQWKSHLIVQSRTDDRASGKRDKPHRQMSIRNALSKNQDAFITITSGSDGSALYVNGQRARTYPRHHLLAGYASGPSRFILGNSPTGESYWNGNLMGLAIYNGVLSADQVTRNYRSWLRNDPYPAEGKGALLSLYPFTERQGTIAHNETNPKDALIIPEIFKPVNRKILYPGWPNFSSHWSFAQDVTINILGFIPLGFFFSALLMKVTHQRRLWVYLITAILGLCISVFIEVSQAYLPTRDSSLADVVWNGAGTILGIAIFQVIEKGVGGRVLGKTEVTRCKV
jgi:hypothetical protein